MEEKKIDLTLSSSKIKTYKTCPRKYYYSYITKLPKLNWEHFNLGILVHGVLEIFHKNLRNNNSLNSNNIKKIMKEAFQEQKIKMEKSVNGDIISLKNETLFEARDLLKDYLKNIIENGIKCDIIELEDEFELSLNEKYSIKGIVDRLDVDYDGIYHIKDYKTTKDPKYMEPSQLQIYGLYLFDKFPNINKYRGSYVMLRLSGMLISYDFTKDDIDKEKQKIIECADLIMEEEKWTPKYSNLCDWCDFKSTCLNSW